MKREEESYSFSKKFNLINGKFNTWLVKSYDNS